MRNFLADYSILADATLQVHHFFYCFFFSCIFVDELHIGSNIYQQVIPCHYQAVELTVRTFIGKICCAISEKWNNRFGNLSATYAVPFPRIRIIELGIYRQHIPCHFHRIRHLSVTYSVPFPGSRIILIFSRFKCKTFPRYKNVFLKKKKNHLFINGPRVDAFLDT